MIEKITVWDSLFFSVMAGRRSKIPITIKLNATSKAGIMFDCNRYF